MSTQTGEMPRFVYDMLAAVPAAGEGVHNWLFRMARVLHPYRDEREIAAILHAATANCGRHVTDGEIGEAIANSKGVAWRPGSNPQTPARESKWPEVNQEQCSAYHRSEFEI